MTRLVLSFSISSAVLGVGLAAAWVQSANYARAADLDWMQEECEWYRRRISCLRAELERFEFELRVEENGLSEGRPSSGLAGRSTGGEQ